MKYISVWVDKWWDIYSSVDGSHMYSHSFVSEKSQFVSSTLSPEWHGFLWRYQKTLVERLNKELDASI